MQTGSLIERVNERLMAGEIVDRLYQWLPGGGLSGREYVCAGLQGGKGKSLKVNIAKGLWKDFAAPDKGGDLVSLYAATRGIEMGAAARELAGEMGLLEEPPPPRKPAPVAEPDEVIMPVPADVPEPRLTHAKLGNPSMRWMYRDAEGRLLFAVARYDEPRGKQILPWTWNGHEWRPGGVPRPQPLYGLDRLAAAPADKPVVIVEGEKCADAGQRVFGAAAVVMTWQGGSSAVSRQDWSPLQGRRVVILPDHDDAGRKAARAVREAAICAGAARVTLVACADQGSER